MPPSNRALVVQEQGEAKVVDVPYPTLRNDYVIVKVEAVALNPTDWKHIEYLPAPGAIVGCDYAGVIEEVGKDVTKKFLKGDRVTGVAHGVNHMNHQDGAFATYITTKGDLNIKIPEKISFEEAATLGVGITTVGQGLYQSLGLNLPDNPTTLNEPVLIYAGSTATGTLAIQFAKLSGYKVITTASKHNFDLLKSLGADEVFDYNSSTCAEDIKKATDGKLKYVFDCISEDKTAKICADSIGSTGGKYSGLLEVKNFPRSDVENRFTLAYTAIGEGFALPKIGRNVEPSKEDYEFAVKFWNLSSKLLEESKFKVHPVAKRDGGLDGILGGLQELKEGKNSGVKLVYKLE